MIAWLLISFFVLLFLGVPIAMSLGLSAMGGILFLGGGSTVTIAQRMFEGMNSFALLAIPLYTFAGFTMSKGGISKRLMDFCYSIVGHIYGGLAHVNVLSSMIFAGISGSAVADTAGGFRYVHAGNGAQGLLQELYRCRYRHFLHHRHHHSSVYPHGGHCRYLRHFHR